MKTYTCTLCIKEFKRYPSTVRSPNRVYCSKRCKDEHQSTINIGPANPNYRDGVTLDTTCACGSVKDTRAKQCSGCAKVGHPVGKRGYSKYSDSEIIEAIESTLNFTLAAKRLGVNRKTIQRVAQDYGIESLKKRLPNHSKVLGVGDVRNGNIRGYIRRHKLLEYSCSNCRNSGFWQGSELVLELDHINGNPADNRLENLRWLCPNCHSQTPTYCRQNKKEVLA